MSRPKSAAYGWLLFLCGAFACVYTAWRGALLALTASKSLGGPARAISEALVPAIVWSALVVVLGLFALAIFCSFKSVRPRVLGRAAAFAVVPPATIEVLFFLARHVLPVR